MIVLLLGFAGLVAGAVVLLLIDLKAVRDREREHMRHITGAERWWQEQQEKDSWR